MTFRIELLSDYSPIIFNKPKLYKQKDWTSVLGVTCCPCDLGQITEHL